MNRLHFRQVKPVSAFWVNGILHLRNMVKIDTFRRLVNILVFLLSKAVRYCIF